MVQMESWSLKPLCTRIDNESIRLDILREIKTQYLSLYSREISSVVSAMDASRIPLPF